MVTGILSVIVVGATITLVVVSVSTVSYYLKDKLRRMPPPEDDKLSDWDPNPDRKDLPVGH